MISIVSMAQFGEFFASDSAGDRRGPFGVEKGRCGRSATSNVSWDLRTDRADLEPIPGRNVKIGRRAVPKGATEKILWVESNMWISLWNWCRIWSFLVHSKSILVYGQKLNCLSASRQVRRFHPEQSFQAQQLAIGTAGTAGSLHGRNGWAIDGNHCCQSAAERSCSSAWKIVLGFLETSGDFWRILVLSDSTS